MKVSVNLWECMTAIESEFSRGNLVATKVTKEDLQDLGLSALWNGQELSILATEEGWKIKIFSCYAEDDSGIEILIPKKYTERVKILKDLRGKTEFHYD